MPCLVLAKKMGKCQCGDGPFAEQKSSWIEAEGQLMFSWQFMKKLAWYRRVNIEDMTFRHIVGKGGYGPCFDFKINPLLKTTSCKEMKSHHL